MIQKNMEINRKKLLLVEGKDEENLFKALLNHMNITNSQVEAVGGIKQFRSGFEILKDVRGFSDVEILSIIRDAEQNTPDDAYKSIKGVLKDFGLSAPDLTKVFSEGKPRIGIFIMPDNVNKGMLEDLLMKTVAERTEMDCVNSFLKCLDEKGISPGNKSKAKAQAYLAT